MMNEPIFQAVELTQEQIKKISLNYIEKLVGDDMALMRINGQVMLVTKEFCFK